MIKVKVVLFASLREALGESELDLEIDIATGQQISVVEIARLLGNKRGNHWFELLSEDKVLSAVNHTMVDDKYSVADGDEVAFYPPVTGG